MPKQWKHQEILSPCDPSWGLDASGKNIPNYHYEDLLAAAKRYSEMGLQHPFILVDTNHDNSGKQFEEQVRIVRETMMNRAWNKDLATLVRGFMIESYLEDGRQNEPVVYGQSITDPCLGWENTGFGQRNCNDE